jgi:hypothetical protein
MDIKAFADQLKIDSSSLREELEQHAHTYWQVAKEVAKSINERDYYKKELRDLEAATGERLRDEGISADGKPPSEERLKRMIQNDKACQQAAKHHAVASARAAEAEKLEMAFQQRSYMLTRLADMQDSMAYGDGAKTEPTSKRHRRNRRVET